MDAYESSAISPGDLTVGFVELAPMQASAPARSATDAGCEIVVANVVLRIGSDVPMSRMVELIRARVRRDPAAGAHCFGDEASRFPSNDWTAWRRSCVTLS